MADLLNATVRAKILNALTARQDFSKFAIEQELGAIFAIGDDVPTVDDDEFHHAITELSAEYVRQRKPRATELE